MQALYLVQSGEKGGGSCQQADCGLDNTSGSAAVHDVQLLLMIGVEVLGNISAGKSVSEGSTSSQDSD